MPRLLEEELTYSVNGAGFEVYNTLGYGFLEHIYVRALELELMERGHRVSREYAAIVFYKGHELATQRMDLVVDEKLIVETKATQRLPPEAPRQLFNYLRATTFQVGLLLHFGPAQSSKSSLCHEPREQLAGFLGMPARLFGMRVDKWLWAARFFKTRSQATDAIDGGHVEVNGERAKPAKHLSVGDELRIRLNQTTYVIHVRGFAERRGPASEARQLYEETPASVAERERLAEQRRLAPTPAYEEGGRPTKRDRRDMAKVKRRY